MFCDAGFLTEDPKVPEEIFFFFFLMKGNQVDK